MNRSGFTLMEMVVALTVTGAALSAGYLTLSSLVDNRKRALEATEEVARASAIRSTVISWLKGARIATDQGSPPFQGLDGVYQELSDDELTFLTTASTPLRAGEAIIRLYIDRNPETSHEGLVASIAEWHGVRSIRIEIDPRIQQVDIRYASSVTGTRHWLPSWISSTLLPAAVEMRLSAGPDTPLPPLLGMPILVAFGGGT